MENKDLLETKYFEIKLIGKVRKSVKMPFDIGFILEHMLDALKQKNKYFTLEKTDIKKIIGK